jgi:cytochrome c
MAMPTSAPLAASVTPAGPVNRNAAIFMTPGGTLLVTPVAPPLPTATLPPVLSTPANHNSADFSTPGGPVPTSISIPTSIPTRMATTPTPGPVGATRALATATSASAAAATRGDPARGRAVFTGVGTCNSCHDVSAGIKIVGPSLKGIANTAGRRIAGVPAEAYLRESILQPNKFVVPGFPSGIMPQAFAQTLNPQQINDVIAYLLTLK